MTEVEILRYLVGALLAVSGVIGTALISVLCWVAKLVLKRIAELGVKIDGFDRRVLRLETRASLRNIVRSGGDD